MKNTESSAVILILSILQIVFTSCGGSTADTLNNSSDTIHEVKTTTAETKPDIDSSNILNRYERVDMNGEAFMIFTSQHLNSTITLNNAPEDTQNGEIVNDALYDRDRQLEERYNISISYLFADTDPDIADIFKKEVVAGETSFDIMMGSVLNNAVVCFNAGMTLNLTNLPHIDIERTWWAQNIMKNFLYNGKIHMLVGEFTPRNVFPVMY